MHVRRIQQIYSGLKRTRIQIHLMKLNRQYCELNLGPNHSLLVWIERIGGFARFCSFGAVGECAKHAYAPSPAAHNAFFFTS
jgi:hypothetical protein